MSIIDNENIVIDLTTEQKKQNAVRRIKRINKHMYENMCNQHRHVWDIVWNNQQGLTPQEVCDGFGTEAGDLFTYSANLQTMLASVCPDYIVLQTTNEYIINADGTVTIGALKN